MKKTTIVRNLVHAALVCAIVCFMSSPMVYGQAAINVEDYIERIAQGEKPGWTPPTIEELTKGEVKIGDHITAENVDLVKEYLPPAIYESVKKGMVLKMAVNKPAEEIIPQFFWDFTVKNKGKAVMDENGTVRLPDGSNWTGGLPFPEPKTPDEVMANTKFGRVNDDMQVANNRLYYVNKDGSVEKTARMEIVELYTFGRKIVPPLGNIPGYEDTQYRGLQLFTEPLELKGLGQLTVRYYDEYKDSDAGFLYLPAFKRIIRVSATTWQDNVGGSDLTWGDPSGLREPYASWEFKTMAKKLMLMPADGPPHIRDTGELQSYVEHDHGHTFLRVNWAITPVNVVEGVSKHKHIYGRKVFHVLAPPYWATVGMMPVVDIYDRHGALWKVLLDFKATYTGADGIAYGNSSTGNLMYDLQTGHCTNMPYYPKVNAGVNVEGVHRTKLVRQGR